MMQQDQAYWERRAEQELTLAQEATDERAVRAHYELLGFYLNRLYPDQAVCADRSRRVAQPSRPKPTIISA